jgi:hypothetical protein
VKIFSQPSSSVRSGSETLVVVSVETEKYRASTGFQS